MIGRVRITVVSDDVAGGSGLLAEHGLAYWVEVDGRRILFDTGQGMVLEHNAERLGIDLSTADDVVLSHGHYDHMGGLVHVLKRRPEARVFLHPGVFDDKFVQVNGGRGRRNNSVIGDEAALRAKAPHVHLTKEATEIAEGIWITGEIPRHTTFEDSGGPFYLDAECESPDPILDDQSMFLMCRPGIVVLFGCCHAGVVNTLDRIADVAGESRIHAVLGGMHLLRASSHRLEATREALQRYHVRCIVPGHCTGREATMRLWEWFPEKCQECRTGSRFVFE